MLSCVLRLDLTTTSWTIYQAGGCGTIEWWYSRSRAPDLCAAPSSPSVSWSCARRRFLCGWCRLHSHVHGSNAFNCRCPNLRLRITIHRRQDPTVDRTLPTHGSQSTHGAEPRHHWLSPRSVSIDLWQFDQKLMWCPLARVLVLAGSRIVTWFSCLWSESTLEPALLQYLLLELACESSSESESDGSTQSRQF